MVLFTIDIISVLVCLRYRKWKDRFEMHISMFMPITVPSRPKPWTVYARSDTGVVRSNPTGGMVVCLRLFYVWFFPCR
jgi:hypothetical protein